jgi:ATP-binding protein involved in chromosome partitioning
MDSIKTKIIERLSSIKYPEFNRDIISFGILKDIVIDNDIIKILLDLKTNNETHKKEIKDKILNLVNTEFDFNEVLVDFIKEIDQSSNADSKIKNIIAVASCKGGVGKSTVSLNIACELAKKYKVGLLDLDIYGPSLPTMVNYKEQPQMKDNKLIPIEKFGMKLMSFGFINNENSPTIWRGPMVARMTQQFFDNVEWGELDYLILDLPPGTGDIQLTLVQKTFVNGAIIVTTPQDLSLVDVKKGSDMFKKVNVPVLGVVENMSDYLIKGKFEGINNLNDATLILNGKKVDFINDKGEFELSVDIFKGMGGEDESKRLNVPLLGKLNLDQNLSVSGDTGEPYVLNFIDTFNANEFKNISNLLSSQ